MDITALNPNGVDANEVAGLAALKTHLPKEWIGFANLELRDPTNAKTRKREIDVVILTHDRVILVDLKHWHGIVENYGGQWALKKKIKGPSPIDKLTLNGKKLHSLMKVEFPAKYIPETESFVVMCAPDCDFSRLPPNERARTFNIDDFVALLCDPGKYDAFFSARDRYWSRTRPFCALRREAQHFFSVGKNFQAQRLWFADAYPVEGPPVFQHPDKVYEEYLVQRADNPEYLALLRLWDFARLPTEASAYECRVGIAKRELDVLTFIKNRNLDLYEKGVLKPETRDEEFTMRYWEIFQRTRTMSRLPTFLAKHAPTKNERSQFAQLLLWRVAGLHELGVAHTDLSQNTIWIERFDSRVMLSNFAAAHFPDVSTISDFRRALAVSDVVVPENGIAKAIPGGNFRQDVFLGAALAYEILVGRELESLDGIPVIIESDLEEAGIPAALRQWFLAALDVDPERRFPSMVEGYKAYLSAVAPKEASSDTSQLLPFFTDEDPHFKYPLKRILKKGAAPVWVSADAENLGWAVVKYWPHRGRKVEENVPSLLAFFERIAILRACGKRWIPRIQDYGFTDAGVFIAHDYVDGIDFDKVPLDGLSVYDFVSVIREFVGAIQNVHEMSLSHGDLKPEHVKVVRDNDTVTIRLLDLVNYLPEGRTERNSEYSSGIVNAPGDVDDRYAVCKMVFDLCKRATPELRETANALREAVVRCGNNNAWETLAPLMVQLDAFAPAREETPTLRVGIPNASIPIRHTLASDCGAYYISKVRDTVSVVGPRERLDVEINGGTIVSVILKRTSPTALQIASAKGIRYKGALCVEATAKPAYEELTSLLHSIGLIEKTPDELTHDATATKPSVTEVSAARPSEIDIRALWQAVIAVEMEQKRRVVVTALPVFDEALGLNIIACNDQGIEWDYEPSQVVEVTRNNARVGELVVSASRRGALAFRELERPQLLRVGDTLTLESPQDKESLRRRSTAVARILGGASGIPNLMEYFQPDRSPEPTIVEKFAPSNDDLSPYGLNPVQREAFQHLWQHRPLGLLQGPPGTGKTAFISAFVHYAVTKAHFRNVLVLSQAHEAADAVADRIRRLGERLGSPLSMLRFGHQDDISDRLVPIHAYSIQSAYRELFLSELEERFRALAARLELADSYAKDALTFEMWARNILRPTLTADNEAALSELRIPGMDAFLEKYGSLADVPASQARARGHEQLAERHKLRNPSAVQAFQRLLDMAYDWDAALRGQKGRTLEEFFARTRDVVCGTCVGAGRRQLGIDSNLYDLVIIDEAARCGSSELAVAMQSAAWVLLVGDHKQLPPYVERNIARGVQAKLNLPSMTPLLLSDFERVFRSRYGDIAARSLRIQYRMAPAIRALVNALFYNEEHERLEDAPERMPPVELYNRLPQPLKRQVTWYDTSAKEHSNEVSVGNSFRNPLEALIVVDVLKKLERQSEFWEGLPQATIGVISFYEQQVRLIRQQFEAAAFSEEFQKRVRIDTVDAYQGQENDIVILSLVRNNKRGEVGFVRNDNRANVALSRAKERLVIVGSAAFFESAWPSDSPFSQVVGYLKSSGDPETEIIPAKLHIPGWTSAA